MTQEFVDALTELGFGGCSFRYDNRGIDIAEYNYLDMCGTCVNVLFLFSKVKKKTSITVSTAHKYEYLKGGIFLVRQNGYEPTADEAMEMINAYNMAVRNSSDNVMKKTNDGILYVQISDHITNLNEIKQSLKSLIDRSIAYSTIQRIFYQLTHNNFGDEMPYGDYCDYDEY